MPLQAGSGQALSAAFDVGFGWRSAFSAAIKVTGHEGFSARGLLFFRSAGRKRPLVCGREVRLVVLS